MKDLLKSWKFWTAIIAVVLLIVAVVLFFVSPKFCYAVSGLLIGALAGFIGGYFVGKKNAAAPVVNGAELAKAGKAEASAAPKRPTWPARK